MPVAVVDGVPQEVVVNLASLNPNLVQLSKAHHQRLLAIEKSHGELAETLLGMVACIQTHGNSRSLNYRLCEDYLADAVKTLAAARRLMK